MNPDALNELRWLYLIKLYELSEGGLHDEVNIRQLESELGYSRDEARSAVKYLESKDLISFKCRVPCVRITTRGIDEVERIMAQTYAAKEFRVLKTIHETKYKAFNGWVNITDLERDLSDIPRHEFLMILEDLEKRKGLIGSIDQAVWILPAGIEELEQAEQYPNYSTSNFPAQIINNYTVNVQGDNRGNIAQAGQGNNQSCTNHQPISQILLKLAELIEAVKQADFEDKDEIVRDLEKVQQLAQLEDPKSKWALIQSKLSSAKTGMEIVGYGYHSLPYWPVIWKYFFG